MALIGKKVAKIEINSMEMFFMSYGGVTLTKSPTYSLPKFKIVKPIMVKLGPLVRSFLGTSFMKLSELVLYMVADGKDCTAKSLIHDLNEEGKSITFHILKGDFPELYKNIFIHIHVDTKGSNHIVTWTVEYEKLSPDIPDPDTLMEFYTNLTKDIETHHLKDQIQVVPEL